LLQAFKAFTGDLFGQEWELFVIGVTAGRKSKFAILFFGKTKSNQLSLLDSLNLFVLSFAVSKPFPACCGVSFGRALMTSGLEFQGSPP